MSACTVVEFASNNDGLWNKNGAVPDFSILPAFYHTHWFVLLCFMAAGMIVWIIYKWRVCLVTSRLDLQFRERLSERVRIAQDLHDTLLQGFLSASMQLHVANNHLPSDWPAKPLIVQVLEQMENVIDEGRNTLRGLRSASGGSCSLEREFSEIGRELSNQRQVEFRVLVQGTPVSLRPAIHDEIYLVGREALTNAFHHSHANKIEAELQYQARQLRILIRDNGRGINPEVLRFGREGHWGLCGMRERAERIGGKLRVLSGTAAGTEIEFLIPGRLPFDSGSRSGSMGWLSRLNLRKSEARPDSCG
jgi:signal transduction histidine kinase